MQHVRNRVRLPIRLREAHGVASYSREAKQPAKNVRLQVLHDAFQQIGYVKCSHQDAPSGVVVGAKSAESEAVQMWTMRAYL